MGKLEVKSELEIIWSHPPPQKKKKEKKIEDFICYIYCL